MFYAFINTRLCTHVGIPWSFRRVWDDLCVGVNPVLRIFISLTSCRRDIGNFTKVSMNSLIKSYSSFLKEISEILVFNIKFIVFQGVSVYFNC